MPQIIKFSEEGDGLPSAAGSSSGRPAIDASAALPKPKGQSSSAKARQVENYEEEDEEDDDEDAPVEETFSAGAQQAASSAATKSKQLRKEVNLKRKKAQEVRAQAKQTKAKGKSKAKSNVPGLHAPTQEEDEEDDDEGEDELEWEDRDDINDLEEDDLDADLDEDLEEEDSEEEAGDASLSTSAPGSSTRLDPSLFAKAFARQAALAAEDDAQNGKGKQTLKSALKSAAGTSGQVPSKSASRDPTEAKRRALHRQQVKDRRDGIVRGNDGRPMKRLEDRRTVVRALSNVPRRAVRTTFDEEAGAEDAEAEDAVAHEDGAAYADDAYDSLQARPNATARAFLKRNFKRKGGVLHDSLAEEQAAAAKRKRGNKGGPQRTFDDPLGLEDPFLMKGGAYASEGGNQRLTGKPERMRGEKLRVQRSAGRGGGGRVSAAANNRGNAVGASAFGSFARSLV